MRVLVIGLGGVGCEVAKNVILQGSRAVTLYDPNPVEIKDLGVNFCLTEASVGSNRDAESMPMLQELSKECKVLLFDSVLLTVSFDRP